MADGTDSAFRTCPECGHTVILTERAVNRLYEMDIGCADCGDIVMWPDTDQEAEDHD